MAFRRVVNSTDDINDVDIDQFADAFNGVGGKGQPLDLIALDADRYYIVAKNLNANSKVAQLYKQDGTLLLQVDGNGVKASIDGSAGAVAIAPQASPRFTGTVALSGRVLRRRSSTVASAATLTLPSDGDIIPVSGTVTITSVTAIALTNVVDGAEVVLEFQSAGATVKAGNNLILQGDFISAVGGATLRLYCDGTNWHEIARAAFRVPGARYSISAATQSIVSGAERIVSWTATGSAPDYNYGMTAVPTSAPIPGILGRWEVKGAIVRDIANSANIRGWLLKNGSDSEQIIGANYETMSTNYEVYPFGTTIEVTSVTDTYGIGLIFGNTENIIGGAAGCHLIFTYLGR